MRPRIDHTLVARQCGVISREQLERLGFDEGRIKRWLRAGHLRPLHRGVYAVGHDTLTDRGRWWAAFLAGGPSSVLSHRTSGQRWRLYDTARLTIDLTAPRRIRQEGICGHRGRLDPRDVVLDAGLPFTTPERTLVDLLDVSSPRVVERAFDVARVKHRVRLERLEDVLDRCPGRRTALLRRLIAEDRPATVTESPLEEAFLALVRAAGLPEPACNLVVLGRRRDFAWPQHRLIAETDGDRFHSTRRSRADDRRRDAIALQHGWRTVRCSYEDVTRDGAFVVEVLSAALGAAA